MDARGPAPSLACPRCGSEQQPGGERMRTCASCGLVFDATKAQPAMDAGTHAKKRVDAIHVVMPGVVTPAAFSLLLGSVGLFVVGFVGTPADTTQYSRAFAISMALRASALIMFVIALMQTRSVKITVTASELIVNRSWRIAKHVPREALRLGIEGVAGTWRPTYVIYASSGDTKVALAVRVDSDEAHAQVDTIKEALAAVPRAR
jgi:hypothetical protein